MLWALRIILVGLRERAEREEGNWNGLKQRRRCYSDQRTSRGGRLITCSKRSSIVARLCGVRRRFRTAA